MTDLFQEPEDATPLTPAERDGLLPIVDYPSRATSTRPNRRTLCKVRPGHAAGAGRRPPKLLDDGFAQRLHGRMFGDVWEWAGAYRKTERNIGVAPYRIAPDLAVLLDDARFWIEHNTYPPDETAVRVHHRLVWIHPFPNGNGRHARLMADLLIEKLGGEAFSWGGGSLADVSKLRTRYIAALQAADGDDIGPLLAFARS